MRTAQRGKLRFCRPCGNGSRHLKVRLEELEEAHTATQAAPRAIDAAVRLPDRPPFQFGTAEQRRLFRRHDIRLAAVRTKRPNQALRHGKPQRCRRKMSLQSHVREACHGVHGIVRMESGKHQMARQRGLDRRVQRLGVADLADHDHVRVVPEYGSECLGEIHLVGIVHLGLEDAGNLVLDGVLHRKDIERTKIQQELDRRVEGRGLAAAGRSREKHEPVRRGKHVLELVAILLSQPQLVGRVTLGVGLQETQRHTLAVSPRKRRQTHVKRGDMLREVVRNTPRERAVLRRTPLVQLEVRHHL